MLLINCLKYIYLYLTSFNVSLAKRVLLVYVSSMIFFGEICLVLMLPGNHVAEVVNATNSSNQSALDVACRYSQEDSVEMLLKAGADPSKPHEGFHPIHTALNAQSLACVATLLEFHPEQVDVRDTKYGGAPLHWAKSKEVSNTAEPSFAKKKNNRNKNGLKSLNNLLIMSCNISGIASCTYHHILLIQMITYGIT